MYCRTWLASPHLLGLIFVLCLPLCACGGASGWPALQRGCLRAGCCVDDAGFRERAQQGKPHDPRQVDGCRGAGLRALAFAAACLPAWRLACARSLACVSLEQALDFHVPWAVVCSARFRRRFISSPSAWSHRVYSHTAAVAAAVACGAGRRYGARRGRRLRDLRRHRLQAAVRKVGEPGR